MPNLARFGVAAILSGLVAAPAAADASDLKTLYSFSPASGSLSGGLLLVDRHGVMYGTAAHGGANGAGTVFKFDPATGTFTVLYNFLGGADGAQPVAGLGFRRGRPAFWGNSERRSV